MEKSIWKYAVPSAKTSILMPIGAEILSIETQNNEPTFWAMVDPEAKVEERFFEVFMTGHPIPCDMGIERKYIGTVEVHYGLIVLHVFERIN